jgi:hypothetical protein
MSIKTTSFIVAVVLLFVLSSQVLAQGPKNSELDKVTIYKNEGAVEEYAKIMGISVDAAKKMIEVTRKNNTRESNTVSEDTMISSMGTGGHLGIYVPVCAYPTHSAALALFETGYGPINVQYHGNRLWQGTDFCGSANCTFLTTATLPFPGDQIYMYSVTASFSTDISHWCAGGIGTATIEE